MRAALYCSALEEEQCRFKALGLGATDVVAYIEQGHPTTETFDRPALNQLREDVAAGRVDVVVAFAPERLGRRLTHTNS